MRRAVPRAYNKVAVHRKVVGFVKNEDINGFGQGIHRVNRSNETVERTVAQGQMVIIFNKMGLTF